jgi:hypothetical protein
MHYWYRELYDLHQQMREKALSKKGRQVRANTGADIDKIVNAMFPEFWRDVQLRFPLTHALMPQLRAIDLQDMGTCLWLLECI